MLWNHCYRSVSKKGSIALLAGNDLKKTGEKNIVSQSDITLYHDL